MIPSGTRFIGIAESVNLVEKKTNGLNSLTQPYTLDEIRGYKVFTALLTQSGGDNLQTIDSGSLIIGATYQNNGNLGDFTNVGAPNNNDSTFWIATGVTPNNWGEGVYYNSGAPVVTVLENTIGNIWWTYTDIGNYIFNSDGLFTENKILSFVTPNYGNDYNIIGVGYGDINSGQITTINISNLTQASNGLLYNTPIEIRVYE